MMKTILIFLTLLLSTLLSVFGEIVSQWSFEDDLNDTAPAGASADHLEAFGEAEFAGGVVGRAVRITADGLQRLRAETSEDLSLAPNWTLEAFVWPDADNSGEWDRFWTKWEDSQEWHWAFRSTGAVEVENGLDLFINGQNSINSNNTAEVPLEQWSHVALVADPSANTITAWLNGEEVGSAPYEFVVPAGGAMNFGNFDSPANVLQYSGLIDEAIIHSVAVDSAYLQNRAALTMPNPGIRFDRTSVDFGAVPVGDGLQQSNLILTNPGDTEDLVIFSISITNNPGNRFSIISAPATVAAFGTADIVIGFNDGGASGEFAAELVLKSNAQGQSFWTVPLRVRVAASNLLLAHYQMDETAGDTMLDSSGNGYDGTYLTTNGGSFTLNQTGIASGTAVAFSDGGTNEGAGYGEIPAVAGLPLLQTFSISMWIQIDAADFGTSSLFSKGFSQGNPFGAVVAVQGNADPIQWFTAGNGGLVAADVDLVSTNAQHFVVTHFDGGGTPDRVTRVRFYLDGQVVAESDVSRVYNDSTTSPIQLGATVGQFGFSGLMDDVQIYEKELGVEDVQLLFANPGDPLPDGTPVVTDSDNDGISNEDEDLAGTDPNDPADYFRVADTERTGPDTIVVRWAGKPGKHYSIEYAESLSAPWNEIGTHTSASDEPAAFEDNDGTRTTRSQGYYRVRVGTNT